MIKADGGGGALVYIILAVISLIVSAVSKSQNKKMPQAPTAPQPQQQEPIPAEPQPTWQRELEDIFGKVLTQPERKPEPVAVPVETVDSRVSEWNKYAQARESKPEEVNTKSSPEVIEEEEHHELALAEDFDLRRAVVYSEVLNRKYF